MTSTISDTMPCIPGTGKYVGLLEQLFETLLEIEAMAAQMGLTEIAENLFDANGGDIPVINTQLLDDYAFPTEFTDEQWDLMNAFPQDNLTDDQFVWYQLRERLQQQEEKIYELGLANLWTVVFYSMWRQAHAGE